jgi:hypothetical protein
LSITPIAGATALKVPMWSGNSLSSAFVFGVSASTDGKYRHKATPIISALAVKMRSASLVVTFANDVLEPKPRLRFRLPMFEFELMCSV